MKGDPLLYGECLGGALYTAPGLCKGESESSLGYLAHKPILEAYRTASRSISAAIMASFSYGA